ncbi:MAG: hypothetical protein JW910_02005 [Anaerolineae bacterium]|nr:hypothetical protein [Anaerolineae bacterium]
MELIALWKFLLRRWWVIVLPALVTLVFAMPDVLNPPAGGFTTTIRLTAAHPPTGNEPTYEDSSYIPWLASEYLVNSLTAWATTGSFAQEVSAALAADGLEIDAGAVRGSITADNARSVMALYISWPDAGQLEAIARAAITVMQTRNQVYFPQFAAEPADVIALDDVAIAPTAPGLMTRLQPLLKVALGLAAGLALAALWEYLDDSIRSRDDVEDLEIAVLAEIPRHRGGA